MQQYFVVDSIKSCRQVKEGESNALTLSNANMDVTFNFQKSRLSRVCCFICRLQGVYQIVDFEVLIELRSYNAFQQFGNVTQVGYWPIIG